MRCSHFCSLLVLGGSLWTASHLLAREGGAAHGERTWYERMIVALDKKLTVEFIETPLPEAVGTVSELAGLNVIVDPKLREQKLKVSLSCTEMDAATVLKWIARLTGTHILLVDRALLVTGKPPPGQAEKERFAMVLLALAHRVDPSLLPPHDKEPTDEDILKLALAIAEKTNPKPQDFPAPEELLNTFGKR